MLKVVAVDCNPAQSALLELKATAIRYSLPLSTEAVIVSLMSLYLQDTSNC